MTLREKLIVLRDKAGISQMTLAHQLGVSRQAVSRWESGDATPSMDKLKALAKIYGVSLDWLCSDSDMADEKPIEVVSPLEENETKNTTVFGNRKKFGFKPEHDLLYESRKLPRKHWGKVFAKGVGSCGCLLRFR